MEKARATVSRRSPALPLAALLLCHAAIVTADSHGNLLVSASVTAVARLETLASPSGFAVSAGDAQRGYVNVTQPVQLRVYSNSRAGYELEVRNLASSLPGITLSGLGQDVDLLAEGGKIVQRWDAARSASLTLRFRFQLPRDLPPGIYPWPVQLGVRPL